MVSNFLGGGTSVVGEIVSGDAAIEAGVRRRASRADVEGDEGVGRAAAESVEDGGVVESEGDDAAVGADVWRPERCHAIVVEGGAVRAAVGSEIGGGAVRAAVGTAIGFRLRQEVPRRPFVGVVRHVDRCDRFWLGRDRESEETTRPAVLIVPVVKVEEELFGGRWWRFSGTGGPMSS